MGGADVIRQALRAGLVEELSISIAPVVLGGGKRLFDHFDETTDLEHVRLLRSPLATHITYSVVLQDGGPWPAYTRGRAGWSDVVVEGVAGVGVADLESRSEPLDALLR